MCYNTVKLKKEKTMFLANNSGRKRKWSQDVEVKSGSLTKLLGAEPSSLSAHTIAVRVLKRLKKRSDRIAALRKLNYVANLQENKNPLIAKKFHDAAHEISRHLMGLERNPSFGSYADKEEEEYNLVQQILKHYLHEIEKLKNKMLEDGVGRHEINEMLSVARHHMQYLSGDVSNIAHYIFEMVRNVGKE